MRRGRNNLEGCPFPVRETACRLLHEGAKYGFIRAEIAKLVPGVKIHNSTLLAYAKRQEYLDYVQSRRQWDDKLKKRQWAAAIVNDGNGVKSLSDLAAQAILEQLHTLAEGGLLETGKDVATVANSIANMQRTQLAMANCAKDAEIERLKAAHEAERISLEEEIAKLQAELANLKAGGKVDFTAAAAKVAKILGGGQ
jgi:hypothetical protein